MGRYVPTPAIDSFLKNHTTIVYKIDKSKNLVVIVTLVYASMVL